MKSLPNQAAFELVCQLLAEGREVILRVEGESMLPFFRSGCRIRILPIRNDELKPGHIVLGRTVSGHFVIHRILHIDAENILLQGDGNLRVTENIPRERIYGYVACNRLHRLLARLWRGLGSLRRYPLWLIKRFDRPALAPRPDTSQKNRPE